MRKVTKRLTARSVTLVAAVEDLAVVEAVPEDKTIMTDVARAHPSAAAHRKNVVVEVNLAVPTSKNSVRVPVPKEVAQDRPLAASKRSAAVAVADSAMTVRSIRVEQAKPTEVLQ